MDFLSNPSALEQQLSSKDLSIIHSISCGHPPFKRSARMKASESTQTSKASVRPQAVSLRA
jgi:hypothetical protein